MQKIVPYLWFDGKAEEAMRFYTSIFKDSSVKEIRHLGNIGPDPTVPVVTGTFQIAGQEFHVLDGGPQLAFSPAISFFVNCDTQEEVDYLWERLSEGGEKQPCGWLQDKYGVSWQIIPTALGEMMGDPDPVKAGRVTQAMLKMSKIDIRLLKQAYEGR